MTHPEPSTTPMSTDDGNAIVDALGAMLMAIGRALPEAQAAAVADGLRQIAGEAQRSGKPRSAALISDLSVAAEAGRKPTPPAG